MAVADELVEEIFSWIHQSKHCAEKLRELAQELESLREKYSPHAMNTLSVFGKVNLLGAGVATLLTAGAALPLLGAAGATYAMASASCNTALKLAEDFTSSDSMKDAEKMAKNISETEGKIKQLFLQLKEEEEARSSESDEQEGNDISQVLGAVARRTGTPCPVTNGHVSKLHDSSRVYLNMLLQNPVRIKELVHRFTLLMEKIFFPSKSPMNLVGETSTASLKGGAKVPLPVMIDNCKDSIRKYHVTEASQSLRSKADEMLEDSQELEMLLMQLRNVVADIQLRILRNHQIPSETDQGESSCSDEEERWARMGLLNVCSLNNKVDKVRRLIMQNKLDVFLPTETRLKPCEAHNVLSQASPENFSFCHQSRGGSGQGVAIQYSTEFQGRQINIESMETFQCVALDLRHDNWDAPILLVNVYHRGHQNRAHFDKFLMEFEKLLKEISYYKNVLLTGDFNIRVDEVYNKWWDWKWLLWLFYRRRSPERDFCLFLLTHGLDQHVRQPTHKRGHILDLVITRNVQISSLFVRNDDISDHYTVYFSARPDGKKKICKKNKEQEPGDL